MSASDTPAGPAASSDAPFEPLRPASLTLRPTGAGGFLLGVAGACFVFAWIGGGSFFSAVAALGGALSVVGVFSAWRNASGLRIGAPPPVTAFANEAFSLDVPVGNLAPRGAAYDVLFTLAPPIPGPRRIGALVPRIAAGSSTRIDVVHPTMRRGLHPQGTIELTSGFPLGLWTCTLAFALPHVILALPRLGTLRRLDRRGARLHGSTGQSGAAPSDEQEVYGIRDWRGGESVRAVHWKLSARRQRLLVREFRNEPRPPAHVLLWTGLPADSRRSRFAFEDAVSLAATLVEDQLREGNAVRLTIAGRERRTIPCSRGRGAILPALRALAEAQADPRAGDGLLAAIASTSRSGEKTYVVRVSDEGADRPGRPLRPDGSAAVFDVATSLRRRRRLAKVFDPRRRRGSDVLLGVRR